MFDNPFGEEILPNIQSNLEAVSYCPTTCYLGEETNPSAASLPFSGHAPAPQCPSSSEGRKLNTVLKVQPHQCQAREDDHFPSPAGHTVSDTSQDAVGHLGTLLAHIQVAVDQQPQVLFCWAAFQPLFPQPVALHGVVVTQMQDLALGFVESHAIVSAH
ncbi:hypothetical protein llap_11351 [Limosa lapponica baueri]|uniref:Uncharacterized protein n=1 Tax=Limosa lapponica baueri TaxID=1758121 RepID=A0A2I0TWZ5_LIMLA|nr:hypothetical protein llap_11351 [Limosa lapponica baueri]